MPPDNCARHQVLEAAEVDDLELEPAHDADRVFVQPRVLAQRQRDVVAHGHRGEQGAALEAHPELAAQSEPFGRAGRRAR
jgi:hypothetical protein